MKRFATLILILVLMAVQHLVLPKPALTATGTYEQQVVDLINHERTSRGLSPLVIHHMLEDAAEAHSMDMYDNSFCSHTSSDGTPWSTRIQQHGYTPFLGLAENVACGQRTPAEVVNDWMNSSGHRANILGDFEHVGVGYYNNFWTMDFGKPHPDTPPPACSLEHDFDGDGVIGNGDLAFVIDRWGDPGLYDAAYDLNDDGIIDVVDIVLLSSEFGTTC